MRYLSIYLSTNFFNKTIAGNSPHMKHITRRKNKSFSISLVSADFHPEFYQEPDKKSISLQQEMTLTAGAPACYEYPPFLLKQRDSNANRSITEHHYDIPNLPQKFVQFKLFYVIQQVLAQTRTVFNTYPVWNITLYLRRSFILKFY